MALLEALIILALVGYAVYRQTRISEVTGKDRFKLAIIYAGIGIVAGGVFVLPHGAIGWTVLLGGFALSAIVGLWRGYLTRLWIEADGRMYRRGTVVTVALFIALVAVKFGIGIWASLANVESGGGFGQVLVMIAVMVAVQAELVWRRAQRLQERTDAQWWAAANERLGTAS